MSSPKRHHYLPEFFIKGFAEGSSVVVYDRQKREYRRQKPRKIAVIGHYYSYQDEDGTKDDSVEKVLSQFEGRAKPVIDKLDRGERLDEIEHVDSAYFLALLVTRVPRHEREREEIVNLALKHITKQAFKSVEAVQTYFAGTPHAMSDEQARSFFKFVHEEQYNLKQSRNEAISGMLEQARVVAHGLATMNWVVVHAPEDARFILSDAPVGFITDEAEEKSGEPVLGVLSEKATKVFPLNRRTALLAVTAGLRTAHASVTKEQVRELNRSLVMESERIVIGADGETVRIAIEEAGALLANGNIGSKVRLTDIPHSTDPHRSYMILHRVRPGCDEVPLALEPEKAFEKLRSRLDPKQEEPPFHSP